MVVGTDVIQNTGQKNQSKAVVLIAPMTLALKGTRAGDDRFPSQTTKRSLVEFGQSAHCSEHEVSHFNKLLPEMYLT